MPSLAGFITLTAGVIDAFDILSITTSFLARSGANSEPLISPPSNTSRAFITVGGFDGSPDAVDAVNSGEMAYTVLQPVVVFSAEGIPRRIITSRRVSLWLLLKSSFSTACWSRRRTWPSIQLRSRCSGENLFQRTFVPRPVPSAIFLSYSSKQGFWSFKSL